MAAQRIGKMRQAVVIRPVHQCEQLPRFAGREVCAREPFQVMSGQIAIAHPSYLPKGILRMSKADGLQSRPEFLAKPS